MVRLSRGGRAARAADRRAGGPGGQTGADARTRHGKTDGRAGRGVRQRWTAQTDGRRRAGERAPRAADGRVTSSFLIYVSLCRLSCVSIFFLEIIFVEIVRLQSTSNFRIFIRVHIVICHFVVELSIVFFELWLRSTSIFFLKFLVFQFMSNFVCSHFTPIGDILFEIAISC